MFGAIVYLKSNLFSLKSNLFSINEHPKFRVLKATNRNADWSKISLGLQVLYKNNLECWWIEN